MKKILIVFVIIVIVALILSAVMLYIIKTKLSTENINRMVTQTAEKSGYQLSFSGSKYNLRLFSLSAELENVKIESDVFTLSCRRIVIVLNPFLAIQKKFELSNLVLENPILTIHKSDTLKENKNSGKSSDALLTTNLRIVNGEVIYDTLSLNEINGQIFLGIDKKTTFTGKISFLSKIRYMNNLKKISVSFNGSYDGEIDIERASVATDYFKADAAVNENNGIFNYSLHAYTDSSDFFRRMFLKTDSISLEGTADLFARGMYNPKDLIDSQIKTIVDSFEIKFGEFEVRYKKHTAILDENSFINKQGSSIVVSTNWLLDSLPLELIVIADFPRLAEKIFDARVTVKGVHLKNITDYIKDFDYMIDGRAALISKFNVSFSDMKVLDSLISKSSHKVTVGEAFLEKDSTQIEIKSFIAEIKNGNLKGSMNFNGEGLNGGIYFSGDYFKGLLNANTISKINLYELNKNFEGAGEVDVLFTYDIKKKAHSLKANGLIHKFTEKNINDTLEVCFTGFSSDDVGEFSLASLSVYGNYVDGVFTNLSLRKSGKKEFINGTAGFRLLNYDSLFVSKKSEKKEKKESSPPLVDKKYEGEIKAVCERIIFKSEDLRNTEITIKIKDGQIFAYPLKTDLMKGRVTGNIEYYSFNNGLIKSKVRSSQVDINEFLTRNKFVPFTIGAKVDMESDLEFLQHKVKESIRGTVKLDAKDGWILMPDIISNVSKVLKLSLSDTFYFDDMYGEFDIDSQRVKFDDFFMEKNGHSLKYSGRVDFAKNMKLKGSYIIDMKTADIGLLERILKAAEYPSDSITVEFDVTGTYSNPKVSIRRNSVGEYLKNQTSETVNGMLQELNNLFKF